MILEKRTPILQITSVGKTFQNQTVFDDISFDINRGEFVSLVGHSGCGKSTLLNIIANLSQPSNGQIIINDKIDEKFESHTVLVFQDYSRSLYPWFTVSKNINIVLNQELPKNERKQLVRLYLEIVGLVDIGEKYPWQLSGGMQQRVAIARALAAEPTILLMDEPFGSIDAYNRRDLELELLHIWKKFNITVLFVTHDIDEAIFLSTRILIMGEKPSKIINAIDIDFHYPRDYIKTRNSSKFGEYREIVLHHLNGNKL